MSKLKDTEEKQENLSDHAIAALRKYTDEELTKWWEHFQKSMKEITVSMPTPHKVKILDIEKILFEYGATNKDGAVLYDAKGDGLSTGGMSIRYPTKFAEINHVIESVHAWRGKKEYGKRKSLEELSKGVAEDKTITYDKPRICSQCPKELPAHLKDVCSGECYVNRQQTLELTPDVGPVPE